MFEPQPQIAIQKTASLFLLFFLFAGSVFAEGSSTPDQQVLDLRTRTSGEDWPRFLGPTGESKSSEKILLDWPETGPPLIWHRKVGEGYAAPTTSKGRLFFFDRIGDQARLVALNAETGEELWKQEYATDYEDMYDYSGGPRASPLVDGDRVYTYGVGGRLRAHHVLDGRLLWDIDTVKDFGVVQNFFGVGSNLVMEEDLLIVMVGGSPPDSPSISSGEVEGNGSGIVAFDKLTGKVRYRFSDELASYSSPVIADVGGKRWGFAFTRGGLLGFDPHKGEERFFFPWRAKILESVNAANPVVTGDTVFLTETYGPGSALLRITPEKEPGWELIWKDPRRGQAMQSHWNTPIHLDGYIYGSSGRSSGPAELRSVELSTGKVMWSAPGLTRATQLYADGHLIVLAEYGKLLLVKANPKAYELVAEIDLGDRSTGAVPESDAKKGIDTSRKDRPVLRFPAWNAPVLSHGLLYLRGKDQLLALDISPGAVSSATPSTKEGESP